MQSFQSFHAFIENNLVPIIFAYGLTFFTAGLIIALQPKRLSSLRLARHLWLLAAFGIIHGVAEWGDIFIPIQSPFLTEFWIDRLWDLQQIAWAVSFVFLLQFGATVTAYHLPWKPEVKTLILQLLPIWGMIVILAGIFYLPDPYGQSYIRYLIGFPAAVLTAIAFLAERRTFTSYRKSSRVSMVLIAVAFGLYAVLSGMAVPEQPLPGLGWLSYENIFHYSGMPVFFWRMIIGILFTVLIVRTLHLFDIEYRERLEKAESERALAEERQRIARDLHDGVVQAIYATGLQLEVAERKAASSPQETARLIKGSIDHLNDVITSIRRYIYNLAAAGEDESGFEQYIRKIIDEFSAAGSIKVGLDIGGKRVDLTPKQKQNIAFIVQECLSNIIKHAGATKAEIKFNFAPEGLVFSVRDDGVGLNSADRGPVESITGRGLKGIRERAAAIDADMVIDGNAESGTVVSLRIPYRRA